MACKNSALLLLAVALVPWLGGCAFFSAFTKKEPQYTLTLHQVVKGSNPDRNRVMPLTSFSGETVRVRMTPLLSSCDFLQIEKVEAPGKPIALDVSLDQHGVFVWTVTRRDLMGEEIAIALDGWWHGTFTIPAMTTDDDAVMRLPGPWDQATADAIVGHVKDNYAEMSSSKK